jgi:hypothetical protein
MQYTRALERHNMDFEDTLEAIRMRNLEYRLELLPYVMENVLSDILWMNPEYRAETRARWRVYALVNGGYEIKDEVIDVVVAAPAA